MSLSPELVHRCSTAPPSHRTRRPKSPAHKICQQTGFDKYTLPSLTAGFVQREPDSTSPLLVAQRELGGCTWSLSPGLSLGGSLNPKSPTVARSFHCPALAVVLGELRPIHPPARDRLVDSGAARLLGVSRKPQRDFEHASCGDPLKDWIRTFDQCTPEVPNSVRSELPIDELLSRSFITGAASPSSASLRQSQSCPAFPKQAKRCIKERVPIPTAHLVSDPHEHERKVINAHSYRHRRKSFSGAARVVQGAIRMRRNSLM